MFAFNHNTTINTVSLFNITIIPLQNMINPEPNSYDKTWKIQKNLFSIKKNLMTFESCIIWNDVAFKVS